MFETEFLERFRKQLVDLEYAPPGRAQPEFFSSVTQRPIVWDVIGKTVVLLLHTVNRVTLGVPPVGPGVPNPATKPATPPPQPKTFYPFSLRFLQAEYITTISAHAGFQIDGDARKVLTEPELCFHPLGTALFYNNPEEAPFSVVWNIAVWERVEQRLVDLGLRMKAVSVPPSWAEAKAKLLGAMVTPTPAPQQTATTTPPGANTEAPAAPVETPTPQEQPAAATPAQGEGLNPLL